MYHKLSEEVDQGPMGLCRLRELTFDGFASTGFRELVLTWNPFEMYRVKTP